MYDHAQPWVTHASVQGDEFEKTPEWREAWRKPVIFDEVQVCSTTINRPLPWNFPLMRASRLT
jgi:hypothetical protein